MTVLGQGFAASLLAAYHRIAHRSFRHALLLGMQGADAMPRYFFHVQDGKDLPDAEGIDLVDADQARLEAIRAAGEMLTDIGPKFWRQSQPWTMRVVDEDNAAVCNLSFSADLPAASG